MIPFWLEALTVLTVVVLIAGVIIACIEGYL